MNEPRPLLEVDHLSVRFQLRRGLFGSGPRHLDAVRDVTFDVGDAETVGLVGESGSGKSTIGRAILRLVEPSAGTVRVAGVDVPAASGPQLRELRRDVQVVFQDPYSSLNPTMTVGSALVESLRHHRELDRGGARRQAAELLERVGLSARHLDRYPQEFSGGQRQRIAIARALAPEPRLVVCDEPVSALDVSTQAQVVNLFEDLQESLGVSLLFIAHDLAVVRHLSHRIAVLYLGKLVEIGPADRVYDSPAHPYTETLLASVPEPNPQRQRVRRAERAESATKASAGDRDAPGCPFQHRCPHVMDICRSEMPALTPVDGGGAVACHLQTNGATLSGRPLRDLTTSPV